MPWLSACRVLLGHQPLSREGQALLVASSRSESGQVEGSQVPSPATPLKRKWLPLTTPPLGARPLQWGLEKGRLHSPGAPLGRVDLEALLSAGDDMLRVELGTCVKGAACSLPGIKRIDRLLCVRRRANSRTWGESSSTLDSRRSVSVRPTPCGKGSSSDCRGRQGGGVGAVQSGKVRQGSAATYPLLRKAGC